MILIILGALMGLGTVLVAEAAGLSPLGQFGALCIGTSISATLVLIHERLYHLCMMTAVSKAEGPWK